MITSAKYTDSSAQTIRVVMDNGDVLYVPDDMENRHRRQIEEEDFEIQAAD